MAVVYIIKFTDEQSVDESRITTLLKLTSAEVISSVSTTPPTVEEIEEAINTFSHRPDALKGREVELSKVVYRVIQACYDRCFGQHTPEVNEHLIYRIVGWTEGINDKIIYPAILDDVEKVLADNPIDENSRAGTHRRLATAILKSIGYRDIKS